MITLILLWIKRYQWAIMISLWLASLGGVAWKTHQLTVNSIEAKQGRKTIAVMEKRNEISNNRPDTPAFLNGLLQDSNW